MELCTIYTYVCMYIFWSICRHVKIRMGSCWTILGSCWHQFGIILKSCWDQFGTNGKNQLPEPPTNAWCYAAFEGHFRPLRAGQGRRFGSGGIVLSFIRKRKAFVSVIMWGRVRCGVSWAGLGWAGLGWAVSVVIRWCPQWLPNNLPNNFPTKNDGPAQ